MTTQNITLERIDALRVALEAALYTVGIIAEDMRFSAIDHVDAAAIVNETIQNLTNEAR